MVKVIKTDSLPPSGVPNALYVVLRKDIENKNFADLYMTTIYGSFVRLSNIEMVNYLIQTSNIVGPQGPAGADGAPGPQGPPGADGVGAGIGGLFTTTSVFGQSIYHIPHGINVLGDIKAVIVGAGNSDTVGFTYWDWDATNINVYYTGLLPIGGNTLKFNWNVIL